MTKRRKKKPHASHDRSLYDGDVALMLDGKSVIICDGLADRWTEQACANLVDTLVTSPITVVEAGVARVGRVPRPEDAAMWEELAVALGDAPIELRPLETIAPFDAGPPVPSSTKTKKNPRHLDRPLADGDVAFLLDHRMTMVIDGIADHWDDKMCANLVRILLEVPCTAVEASVASLTLTCCPGTS